MKKSNSKSTLRNKKLKIPNVTGSAERNKNRNTTSMTSPLVHSTIDLTGVKRKTPLNAYKRKTPRGG